MYLRMMLRDNKFNEALLQSDTPVDSREIKATRLSLYLSSRHSFQRNRRGQCCDFTLLVIQWKWFFLNVFLVFSNVISQLFRTDRSQVIFWLIKIQISCKSMINQWWTTDLSLSRFERFERVKRFLASKSFPLWS